MSLLLPRDIDVLRRRDHADPINERKLHRAIAAGIWTKLAAGVFVRTADWDALSPIERHRVFVREALRRMRPGAVVSRFAAAALHGIDVLGPWPAYLDVTLARATGGRSTGIVRRHATGIESLDLEPFGEHFVTTPAQTALDLARVVPHAHGVAIVDQAIRSGRTGGALTTIEEIMRLHELAPPHRGDARALRAISFATPLSANVRESQSRVVIARLGFPRPRLQERRVLRSGRLVFGDFYWPDHDHWGEFDGHGKYLHPQFRTDLDPAALVIDEKNRENEIRREVRGFSRWEPMDADNPRRLYDILTGDGLPSALPRP